MLQNMILQSILGLIFFRNHDTSSGFPPIFDPIFLYASAPLPPSVHAVSLPSPLPAALLSKLRLRPRPEVMPRDTPPGDYPTLGSSENQQLKSAGLVGDKLLVRRTFLPRKWNMLPKK